ncbi:hypothetical protein M3Y97_00958200 [Aphelenchoides bicaudatus]|nr:hypothetical protein M3Y97_00958200 [Aphelenchoides bicaudatus]
MEDIVRRLNGHVIRALKCVCQRAASIAILNGFPCVKNVCFDKAIQYVVFRQNIRPFVIRPRPNMASLHMDSPASSTMQNIDFNVERMVKNKGRIYSRRLALAKAVQKRKNILFGSSSSLEDGTSLTNSQRRDAWESVRQDLLLKGFSEFASKSRLDIQKTDWQHVRRYVMDKRKKDSPNKDDPISELDTVVFDIVKSFGRYSTRDSGDNNAEDNDMLMDEVNQYINGTSPTISTRNEYSLEENGALPQLSQLLNLQFHPETVESPPLDRNNDVQTKIAEVRLQREEYLRDQQKIRVDIENERLLQERIKTKILLAQLASEDPEVANEFKISD